MMKEDITNEGAALVFTHSYSILYYIILYYSILFIIPINFLEKHVVKSLKKKMKKKHSAWVQLFISHLCYLYTKDIEGKGNTHVLSSKTDPEL